jgi:hypothetical protein
MFVSLGRTIYWHGSSRRVRALLILWLSIIGKEAHAIGTRGGLGEQELLALIKTDTNIGSVFKRSGSITAHSALLVLD